MPRGQIISCFNACKIIANSCLYHVVRVKELKCETPYIESVPIVRKFAEVFPNNLQGVPAEWDIHFGIDLLPDTNPISISPYRMALVELKELKIPLKDLLYKGLIKPSISPWGAPVLFVERRMGPSEYALIIAYSIRSL